MATEVIDLRSDTVTLPDKAMLETMCHARLGDDVYGEDPSVRELEEYASRLLGKEAGVFFCSGTQSNLSAVLAQCGRGDEVIVGSTYHLYRDEAAGSSVLGGVSMSPIPTLDDGSLTPDAVRSAIKEDDLHYARSKLLCLENTVSGLPISIEQMRLASDAARVGGLRVHLDGARFFNAITALQCSPRTLANVADTVSICLSKGLGAPVGSVLVGPRLTMSEARRIRKMLGGGMRQAGLLAAAGLHALKYNVGALAADHTRAAALADSLSRLSFCEEVHQATNILFIRASHETAMHLRRYLVERGILIGNQRPAIRIVLHRNITDRDLNRVTETFAAFSNREM